MNKTTVKIGEVIYKLLKPFKRVYAVIADEGTKFPFIIYKRTSGYSQSDKDGIYSATATIEIMIASKNYDESVDIADKVIKTMESAKGKVADFDIWKIRMIDSRESFIEESFIQELKFTVEFATK